MKKFLVSIAKSRAKFLVLLFAVEIAILSLLSPHFLKLSNLIEILQFGAVLCLLAMGEAMVIIATGGIDISVGSIVSLSCVAFGLAFKATGSIFAAAIITFISGVLMGVVNGILVGYFKLPALIATLGTQYIYASLALYLTNGVAISGFPDSLKFLSLYATMGIPNQILFAVLPAVILVMLFVYKTKYGRYIYLLGTNKEAAKFTAINGKRVILMVYAITGLLCSVGAIINCSWLMTARADAGNGMDMQAITAAVLGGIAVTGGRGHLSGVLMGVLIITMLTSGLQIANINSIWRLAILGLILILSVVFNELMHKLVVKLEKE